MRTFIALEIPSEFRSETAALARRLAGVVNGRFLAPESYHITLAFLGDIDERTVRLAMDALDEACEGRASVPLACDGLGTFGKAHDATLWLGVAPVDALVELAEAVRNELAARDIAFDPKPFKPHITLARRARIPGGTLPPLPFPEPDIADTVTLFKSELDSEGATYTPLHFQRGLSLWM